MRRMFLSGFVMLALAGGLSAPAANLLNGISAVVSDAVITRDDLEALNEQVALDLRRQYRGQPELFQQKMNAARAENLNQLIDRKLILHDFKAVYNIPDSVIDKDVDRIIQNEIRTRYRDRISFIRTLQAQGTTYERYRQLKRERLLIDQLRHVNIASEVFVSPYKIEVYYQTNREQYKVEDEVKLRMIVLNRPEGGDSEPVKRRAEEILAQIKGGASFAEMAKTYSEGSQRNEGGEWGWATRSSLRPELAQAAFDLKQGETSGVIETATAYYLMLVEEVRPAHYKPITEVRDQIEQTLLDQEKNRIEKQWIEKLRKKTFVRVF